MDKTQSEICLFEKPFSEVTEKDRRDLASVNMKLRSYGLDMTDARSLRDETTYDVVPDRDLIFDEGVFDD